MGQNIKRNDILVKLEIKLGESFPKKQVLMTSPTSEFWRDRSAFEGGIIFFVREDIYFSKAHFSRDLEQRGNFHWTKFLPEFS